MTAARTQDASGGYATATALKSLAELVKRMTELALETGWRTGNLVVSTGSDEEEIVVGLKWIAVGDAGYYAAELR